VPEVLSFRINPGVGAGDRVLGGKDAKYGIPFEKAADAYRLAAEMGVKRFGIHMMTGSNVMEEDYFEEAVGKLLEIVAGLPVEIEFMNIGGGFGVAYKPDEKSLDIDRVAEGVARAYEKSSVKPRLMAEPGRYITADAGWLVTKVDVIKDSYKKYVGVDASCNDMPRPSIYGAYHHASVLNGGSDLEKVSVVGHICENNDQFVKDIELPVVSVGDIVILHNCGGHAYSMGHNYNGTLRHAEYLLSGSELKCIRRAETIEDLYGTVEW
ncbi:diaminopimelate decarboxylase, partial [Candidatus Gracilibacteria bacterium]|nr:diaminopimelate decarboxylase [Candidatus Gracilibacteria bacterium]